MKIYQDSKELPLFNYERLMETKDYLYMVKGYDGSQEYELSTEELEGRFNEIVRHFTVSINAKSMDFIHHGKAQKAYMEISKLELLHQIISLKIQENATREKLHLPIDNEDIKTLLKGIKIPKSDNLNEQLKIIEQRIYKHQNDLQVAISHIKEHKAEESQEHDVNEMITNTELVLERTIDMEKTTLYRFGIMQKQAIKKIEYQQTQINSRK